MEKRDSRISSLKFSNYIVNKVNFEANKMLNEKKIWQLTFDIMNKTKINEEKNKMEITLKVELFKGQEEAPFYMDVEIIGLFELEGEDDIKI